jgi:hypothetical protein
MKTKIIFSLLALFLSLPVPGRAYVAEGSAVDVRIISDNGGRLAQYRTYPGICEPGRYFYVEAVKGDRYSIEVTNRSDGRAGVVIAVDGRNIISGSKSELKPNERMYLIDPFSTYRFEGWRTSMNRTNRFYFTAQPDSYAEKAFSDASAMGTIAVAVYREKYREKTFRSDGAAPLMKPQAGSLSNAPSAKDSAPSLEQKKGEQAGTGFGETTFSPARMVHFEPEAILAERVVLKYEWRTELCRKGVISCGPRNRFWPDGGGFAPIPGDFRG